MLANRMAIAPLADPFIFVDIMMATIAEMFTVDFVPTKNTMLVIPSLLYEPRSIRYLIAFCISGKLTQSLSILISEMLRQCFVGLEIDFLPLNLRVENESDMSAVVCCSEVGKLVVLKLFEANFKIRPIHELNFSYGRCRSRY